ncbi:MAG TPA: hypothetical protein VGM51_11105 [Armatimonadota bacterium]|jgi:hypothetical protein
MSGPLLFYIPLFAVAMVAAAFRSVLFGRHRYGYSTPASMCCGCVMAAILLPAAIAGLIMLSKMYRAFE